LDAEICDEKTLLTSTPRINKPTVPHTMSN